MSDAFENIPPQVCFSVLAFFVPSIENTKTKNVLEPHKCKMQGVSIDLECISIDVTGQHVVGIVSKLRFVYVCMKP